MWINPKIVENQLSALISKKISRIHRGANMLVLGFGDLFEVKNLKGEPRLSARFSINIQSVWRLLGPEGIIVGFRDFYHPAREMTYDEYELWEWDRPGNNRFDVISAELRQMFQTQNILVKSIVADEYAGFSLSLDNGYVFEIIPDQSQKVEFWRFIDNSGSEDKHYVFFESEES